jgi:hypothetical protein
MLRQQEVQKSLNHFFEKIRLKDQYQMLQQTFNLISALENYLTMNAVQSR